MKNDYICSPSTSCTVVSFDCARFSRQTVTPARLLARMNASYRMVIYGVPLFGATGGGLLADLIGLRPALVILLAAMTSPVLWILFAPVFRLREMPSRPSSLPGTDEANNGTDE